MKLNKGIKIACLVVACIAGTVCVEAKKKDKNAGKAGSALASLTLKKDSANTGYNKLVKDAQVKDGMFKVIWKEKEGKLYFELSKKVFNRPFMLANRIAQTSDTQDYVAGQMKDNLLLLFTRDARNVYLHQVVTSYSVSPDDKIVPALERNLTNPILKGFKIVETHDSCCVIDVTAFFGTNEKCISPLKEVSAAAKLLGLSDGLKGTFQADASGISTVKTFPGNIEIKSQLSYMTTGAVQKPYTVTMHRSLYFLPEEPMKMRLQDDRVGFFHDYKNIFSSNEDRIKEKKYIHRWRLEPKDEDMAAYKAGKLVEPKQPIIYYVDTAFPEKWRQAIKDGIEVWQKAFEKAGFKNAIQAKDYPADSTGFDPDDMRNNCFRYVGTSTANAMGPSYVDPRTGEILSADVIWYHNIVSLLHNWRFVQTSAVDPRVRCTTFSDELMQESFRYAAAHEIGHTLGLMHNMGASYAFSVENLRDPKFTQQYGTTPSIMDYARNNYVAQPGDVEKGVKLTPPEIGVYDIYAINWGYRLIDGAQTPEEELPVLNRWIDEHKGDRMYEFGAQQVMNTVDPTDQTEDLGNDHIKAGSLGISNLKITLANLTEWSKDAGQEYDNIEEMYKEIITQYRRYINHVMPYIGGTEFHEIRQGDNQSQARTFISKQQQYKAMGWIINELRTMDSWLKPASLINLFEAPTSTTEKFRQTTVNKLLSNATLYRVAEGGKLDAKNCYTAQQYLEDLTRLLFKAPVGGKLSETDRQMQSDAVATMIKQSGLQPAAAKASTASLAQGTAAEGADSNDIVGEDETARTFCSCGLHTGNVNDATSFTRYNVSNGNLSSTEMGAYMLGRLNAVKRLYTQWRATATGETRDFIDYQLLIINRALEK